MRQRTLAALVSGAVGLLAVAPALAADGKPSAPTASTTTSSAPGSSPGATPTSSTSSTTSTTAPPDDDNMAPPDDDSNMAPPDDDSNMAPPDDSTGTATDPACQDAKEQVPAPAEGTSEIYDAGDAGTVEVERISATELEIVNIVPNDGWTEKVATPSGPRVKVRFSNDAAPDEIVRFAASLTSDGSRLRLKVSECEG